MNRPTLLVTLGFCLCLVTVRAHADQDLTKLTDWEIQEFNDRIQAFYANPADPKQMSTPIPKADAESGEKEDDSDSRFLLRSNGPATTDPLLKQAGFKSDERFLKWERKRFARRFPSKSSSHARTSADDDNQGQELVKTWMDDKDVANDLDTLPTEGESSRLLWSSDYWRTQWGQTAYRYADGEQYKNYKEALKAYDQPKEFKDLLNDLSVAELGDTVTPWSPAEKYDLTVGDESFTFTNQQKNVGQDDLDDKGDVESWMGICDGWSAASIMAPQPKNPVDVTGAGGITVHWYPDDVRAALAVTWADADFATNFVGENCEAKVPELYPNGRLKDPKCWSVNPAALTLALGNMIGKAKQSFVLDASYDYQVWNQPMKAYSITYFNPMEPTKRSKEWATVATDYNDAFKARDRFQKPLTRGKWVSGEKWDDSGVKKIVGVMATVVYLDESDVAAADKAGEESYTRATYTYDLELQDDDGKLVPTGGEWHRNSHPNFLWVPQKGVVAKSSDEPSDLQYDPSKGPGKKLTKKAANASQDGLPLCQVIKSLVDQSSGVDTYSCGDGN